MGQIFDTHAHYTSGAFNADREALLDSLPGEGVALVVDCGTDLISSKASLALGERYSWLYTVAGIHPTNLVPGDEGSTQTLFGGNWKAEMDAIRPLYVEKKVIAVGECGLDKHWPVPHEAQLEMFEAHLRLALELDLPIIVHDREAHAETYALLKKYKPRGVLHSYSGSAEDVKWICAQGMYIGFTGVVTFKNAKHPLVAVAAVPDEYLLLETDCPYMAPEPFRGKRSHSGMIRKTAERIAGVRGRGLDEILDMTLQNGKRLFRIGQSPV